jgi:flagellar basal body rod protein FlgC
MIEFSAPMAGLDRASSSLNDTARRVAPAPPQAPVDTVALSEDMVALLEAQRAFEANLEMLRTTSETMMKVLQLLV